MSQISATNAAPPAVRAVEEFSVLRRIGAVTRDAVLRRLLAAGDIVVALIIALLAGEVFGDAFGLFALGALMTPIWVVLAKLHGLYDRDQRSIRHTTVDELPTILTWVTCSVALFAGMAAVFQLGGLPVGTAVRCWLAGVGIAVALRAGIRCAWRRLTAPESALIVGIGPVADAARRKIDLFRDMHVRLVGACDELTMDDLEDQPAWLFVDRIILAMQTVDEELIGSLVRFCRGSSIKLSVVPPARSLFGTAMQLNHVADLPLVEYNTWDVPRSTMLLKRVFDVVGSGLGLVLLLPLFLAVAVAIRLDTRGPIFFSQRRAGRHGKQFMMRKFRTMVVDAEDILSDLIAFDQLLDPMFKIRNDPRVTRVGRFLRRTSIDELPQLWNVLVGDMSLVGPRPEQVELVDRYEKEHFFRLEVKPGITGPMQVFGRGELAFEERLAVDRDYIENLSLRRDLHFLAMTISVVVSGRGAY